MLNDWLTSTYPNRDAYKCKPKDICNNILTLLLVIYKTRKYPNSINSVMDKWMVELSQGSLLGIGSPKSASEMLVMFYCLVWVLVTQMCSNCENYQLYIYNLCTVMFLYHTWIKSLKAKQNSDSLMHLNPLQVPHEVHNNNGYLKTKNPLALSNYLTKSASFRLYSKIFYAYYLGTFLYEPPDSVGIFLLEKQHVRNHIELCGCLCKKDIPLL